MGGFVSKRPEEIESAAKNRDATRERKKDLVVIKDTKNDWQKQYWTLVLIGSVLYTGATTISEAVSDMYWRYAGAEEKVKNCNIAIQNLLEWPETRRCSQWHKWLNSWENEREAAVAFMKKHKYIGKLVEMFPPNLRVSRDSTWERKKDLVEIKGTGNDWQKEYWTLVLIGSVLYTGATTISKAVSDKYWRYVTAKGMVRISNGVIQNLLERPETRRNSRWLLS